MLKDIPTCTVIPPRRRYDRWIVVASLALMLIGSEVSRGALAPIDPPGVFDLTTTGNAAISGAEGVGVVVRTLSDIASGSNRPLDDVFLAFGPQSVPDGGVTLILLGVVLVVLETLRRKQFF
jgi:hypothetical protein